MSDPTGFDDESPEAVVLPDGGGGFLRAILAATITYLDTPAAGTVIDLLDLPAGSYVHDIVLNIRTKWRNNDTTDPNAYLAFGVDFGGPDEARMDPGYNSLRLSDTASPNDNALISGNAARNTGVEGPSLFGYLYFNAAGVPYLPTVALADTTLQARFDRSGVTPLDQGDLDVWVICQLT